MVATVRRRGADGGRIQNASAFEHANIEFVSRLRRPNRARFSSEARSLVNRRNNPLLNQEDFRALRTVPQNHHASSGWGVMHSPRATASHSPKKEPISLSLGTPHRVKHSGQINTWRAGKVVAPAERQSRRNLGRNGYFRCFIFDTDIFWLSRP